MKHEHLVEIMKSLDEIIDTTHGKEFLELFPNQLSAMEVRLAGLRSSLSEAVADADTASIRQTAYTEHYFAKKWLELKKENPKMTNGEIDKMVEVQIWEAREEEFKALKMAKLLKTKHTSYIEVVNAIKDRIKVLMGEKFDRS